jgi:hypothetical protein
MSSPGPFFVIPPSRKLSSLNIHESIVLYEHYVLYVSVKILNR